MNKKTKICMNAMVANEAPTITRMLESVSPYIDYWVVQDNGSTDGTQEIIRNFFKERNIPGFLYETEWLYPGWNRDHALQTCLNANHGCDWILRMDADERLQVDDDFNWEVMNDTTIQSFNIVAHNGGTKYHRTWFWNAKLPWFFQHDKRHETIHLPEIGESFQRINMPFGFRHLVSQDGQTWYVPRKFLRDALELEIDKVVGNKVLDDHYHLWYIAKSYSDCYGNPDELPFGKNHSDEYARRSIWYYQMYFKHVYDWKIGDIKGVNDEMAYFALILMAEAYAFIGDIDNAKRHFESAIFFNQHRNEHYLQYAILLENNGEYENAIEILDKALSPERLNPFPNYTFLIDDRAYSNTSNFLIEMKDRLKNKIENSFINMDSINFDYS
jgi:glycosyltransferase involved in cell wall biosynthesis